MIDREVISIGSSSLENTLHGASDSESSHSERLGGFVPYWWRHLSPPREGTSFVVSPSREPISVIVILPPSTSGEQGEAIGTLGHLPVCDVAIALDCHHPHLPLLAMSG